MKNCKQCKKSLKAARRYKNHRRAFCNITCYTKFNKYVSNKSKKFCANTPCGISLINRASVYCSQICHHLFVYSESIRVWKTTGKDPCAAKGGVSAAVRQYIWTKYQSKCAKCGWNTKHPLTSKPPLEIDHKSGDWRDGSEANLWLLCPNCHALQPTYKNHNRGKGRSSRRIIARKRYQDRGMSN